MGNTAKNDDVNNAVTMVRSATFLLHSPEPLHAPSPRNTLMSRFLCLVCCLSGHQRHDRTCGMGGLQQAERREWDSKHWIVEY